MKESKHIKQNEKKWNKWAEYADGNGRIFEYLRRAQKEVLSLIEFKENINFLDIGCGTGWALGQAALSVENSSTFYGVDMSPRMIEKATDNFKDKKNFHFIQSNAESIPLEDNLFDIIICTNSFHHYLHPAKAMEEIYRLLKESGKIYILDPTADFWLVKVIDILIRILEPQHVKIYSSNEFKELMLRAGLKYKGYKIIKQQQKVQIGEK
jgi:ubiquinone/menaquinone biosynthesis C-methylase UbiE